MHGLLTLYQTFHRISSYLILDHPNLGHGLGDGKGSWARNIAKDFHAARAPRETEKLVCTNTLNPPQEKRRCLRSVLRCVVMKCLPRRKFHQRYRSTSLSTSIGMLGSMVCHLGCSHLIVYLMCLKRESHPTGKPSKDGAMSGAKNTASPLTPNTTNYFSMNHALRNVRFSFCCKMGRIVRSHHATNRTFPLRHVAPGYLRYFRLYLYNYRTPFFA